MKLLTGALATSALLIAPSGAAGREPPNQNDPCSTQGQNTCDTLGVGFYQRYRYGIRWFGDYRRAVPDVGATFCIDLRWWYPDADYKFEEVDAGAGLRNTDGKAVALGNQTRMAHALWNAGRTTNKDQQAAVMLYVHALMGDAAPGEVDPNAISPGVAARYRAISAQADRFRGPYRVETSVSDGLVVGSKGTARIRVRSASGAGVPGLALSLVAEGASGVATRVRTDEQGNVVVPFTATEVAGVSIRVTSAPVASTLPRIFKATTGPAVRNGQRLAAASSQRLTKTIQADVDRGTVRVSTTATPAKLLVGEQVSDRVTIRGVPAGWRASVPVAIHGPFRRQEDIRCDQPAAWQGTLAVNGPGTFTTPAATFTKPGLYTYQLQIPDNENFAGGPTPCGVPAETFRVEVQPRVRTVVTTGSLRPSQQLADRVFVEGLAGESVVVNAALYGPFPSREAIKCDTPPVWTGTIAAAADGEYLTEAVTLTTPGYYTYRETIAAGDFVRATETVCADAAETAIVVGAPQIRTQVSAQETRPGATITDSVVVTGLGALTAQVQVELWGPYETLAAMNCTGTPFWTGSFTANGDGTYTTAPVTLDRAGYYTYREGIAGSTANDPVATACGEASETTFARPRPRVTTTVSDDVVRPGQQIFDNVRVSGLGKTPATVELALFGPFASKAEISCDGPAVWRGRLSVPGDGNYRSQAVTLPRAGFYTYRERLVPSPLVPEAQGECGLSAETALASPLILTGRGDAVGVAKTQKATGPAPNRVAIPDLRINAPVGASTIDTAKGVLNVPIAINRVGWWRDGAAPGDRGTVLLAGHVDSARAGEGAFFNLKNARAGMQVRVTSADGRTRSYRIQSVRTLPKRELPTSVYSQQGANRLVLVTCGGPFLQAEGSYRDNVVVVAVPVS